jgi:enoyl-CoA hydratase/carnithine racemase
MRRHSQDQLNEVIKVEAEIFAAKLRSPEAMEAFQAFFQKRAPDFSKFD